MHSSGAIYSGSRRCIRFVPTTSQVTSHNSFTIAELPLSFPDDFMPSEHVPLLSTARTAMSSLPFFRIGAAFGMSITSISSDCTRQVRLIDILLCSHCRHHRWSIRITRNQRQGRYNARSSLCLGNSLAVCGRCINVGSHVTIFCLTR